MELLLNLVWILLALPAYWLWQKDTRGQSGASSLQCLLALGCALVLLFPVISATDDLHAVRAEMEDSATGKRTVRQAGDKGSPWTNRWQEPPAAVTIATHITILHIQRIDLSQIQLPLPASPTGLRAGRSPPIFG